MMNTQPLPIAATMIPARAGPTRRARLNEALLSAIALWRESGPTISFTNAARVGLSTADTTPSGNANT